MSILSRIGSIAAATTKIQWLPWAFIGATVALSVTWVAAYSKGRIDEHRVNEAAWNKASLEQTRLLNRLQASYREKERQLSEDVRNISDELHSQLDQTRTDYIVALDASRSSAHQLREQWQSCNAPNLSSTTTDSSTTSSNDGARESGFSGPDVEPFLRLATRADQVAHKLEACQDYVKSALQNR